MTRFAICATLLLLCRPAWATNTLIRVVDREGHPIAGAAVEASGAKRLSTRTNSGGEASFELDEGSWMLRASMSGHTTTTTIDVRGRRAAANMALDLYRFQLLLSASTGELLDGGTVQWQCGNTSGITTVTDGIVGGYAAAGAWQGTLSWNGFEVALPRFEIPGQQRIEAELAMRPVTVAVQHADTGRGFGRVLVAAASPGRPLRSPQWSDAEGRLTLYAFPGTLHVQARWFSWTAEREVRVPGELKIDVDLPLRVIPWPDEGMPPQVQIQIRQPGFSAWLPGAPGTALQLPLPEDRYDVVIYDPAHTPLFRGVATVSADTPEARIAWSRASGNADDLRPRRLVWPRAVSPEPPAVAIADRLDEPLDVGRDGSLGLLPDGIELAIPPHLLGLRVSVSGDVVEVRPGAIALELEQAQPVRIADAREPARAIVRDCATTCRVVVAPGLYLVYAADSELLLDPVEVRAGQVTRVRLRPN